MWEKFLTVRFAIEIATAIAIAGGIFFAAKYYYRNITEREMKADYLRVPTNNALIVLGLLVPVFIGLAAYLYTKVPQGNYSSLLAAIVLLFLVLIVAVWETFAILKKASSKDIIRLNMPNDLRYIRGMGLMYTFLIVGLIYFAIFFLFEITPYRKEADVTVSVKPFYRLSKPKANIDNSREEILRIWGEPSSYDTSGTKLIYETSQSTLELEFDDEDLLIRIIEKRKK